MHRERVRAPYLLSGIGAVRVWEGVIGDLRVWYRGARDDLVDLKAATEGGSATDRKIYRHLAAAEDLLFDIMNKRFGYGGMIVALRAALRHLSEAEPLIERELDEDDLKDFLKAIERPIRQIHDSISTWPDDIVPALAKMRDVLKGVRLGPVLPRTFVRDAYRIFMKWAFGKNRVDGPEDVDAIMRRAKEELYDMIERIIDSKEWDTRFFRKPDPLVVREVADFVMA